MRSRLTAALIGAACLLGTVPADAATTPIGHLVVIYDENVSFDHYFGTYPNALNPAGEPSFTAKPGTPAVNGLSGALLTANPNSANPYRLGRSGALTCDNNHGYQAEQQAFDGGAMDKFVQFTSCGGANTSMAYFDGNTVTALWNYAQQYTLSDSYFGTVFGPSLPGHLNLISGNTHGASPDIADQVVGGTVISGPDAAGDECGNRTPGATISFGAAPNIGTLLSAKGVSWGYFAGGFRPTGSDGGGAVCGSQHANVGGAMVGDYVAHHEPFQYYDATRNPTHKAPASAADIGHDDPPGGGPKVNHQYDLADFTTALGTGNVPAVSFLKPRGYQNGHAGSSSPVDEQRFLVETINAIQASSIWPDTAIVIAYDDSDGWYDHVASPIVNRSANGTYDQLDGPGQCHGPGAPPPAAGGYQLRCGFGPRLPLLAISPYSRVNQVDHTVVDQTSILRFIENNWATGQLGDSSFDNIPSPKPTIASMFDFTPGAAQAPKLALDPASGNPPGSPVTPPISILSFSMLRTSFAVGSAPTPIAGAKKSAKPKVGSAFRFGLSRAGDVTILIQSLLPGRVSKGRCVTPTPKLSKAKRCTRAVTKGTLRRTGAAGTNSVNFSGRIGTKALAPGSYRATIAAPGATSRTAGFKIVSGH
jgi:phospholipase C